MGLKLQDHSEIWQVPQQQSSWGTCQISEQYDDSNIQSCSFEIEAQVKGLKQAGQVSNIVFIRVHGLNDADTAKTFHALPDRKSVFYNFFQFQTWLYKEGLLVLPYLSLVLPLFHQSRTEDWQV